MDKLADITAQGWIMAYFIRSDGERFLLGTGAYDFKSDLQHFQPNAMANDIVELQGTDGQLLAGQVRRSATQSFDGYVGDSTQNRERIEELRRDFLMFFRKNFFYKTVYIYPNGTAIQRKRGYLVDAPSVPELYQFFPEYHVALNYEDPNYYEYAEDAQGDEIFANILAIALSSARSGGLVWDAIGAVSHGYIWSNPQIASGSSFQITGIEGAPLALTELKGNAKQTTYSGKNLFPISETRTLNGITLTHNADGTFNLTGTSTAATEFSVIVPLDQANITFGEQLTLSTTQAILPVRYYIHGTTSTGVWKQTLVRWENPSPLTKTVAQKTADFDHIKFVINISASGTTVNYTNVKLMVEKGSSATSFEPYVGGTASPNPDYPQAVNVVTGENVVKITGKNLFNPAVYANVLGNNATRTLGADGSITWVNTTSDSYFPWIYSDSLFRNTAIRSATIPVQPSTQYTVSFKKTTATAIGLYIYEGDSDYVGIKNTYTTIRGDASYTFTTSETTRYVILRFAKWASQETDVLSKIQLEAGSTATAYEPYQGQEYTINLGSIELAKIGTYQDRIYKNDGKWYIEKQVGKYTFDGSSDENWTLSAYTLFSDKLRDYATAGNTPMTQYFVGMGNVSGAGAVKEGCIAFNNGYDWYRFYVRDSSKFSTAESFKTWLASHPTTVYYALATPTTTEITNQALIDQLNFIANLYGGTNNIMLVGTGAQGEIEVEYMTEVDVDGAGYEWEAGGDGGETTITLDAVEAVRPVWAVTGPATDPTLTNITTGETIAFTGTVPAGQTLTVDMDARTATMAGANVFQYITGDWLRLEPGNNRMSYTAGGATEPSTLSWNGVVG